MMEEAALSVPPAPALPPSHASGDVHSASNSPREVASESGIGTLDSAATVQPEPVQQAGSTPNEEKRQEEAAPASPAPVNASHDTATVEPPHPAAMFRAQLHRQSTVIRAKVRLDRQTRVFTAWVNQHLQAAEARPIESVLHDFNDLVLIQLLKQLSPSHLRFPEYNRSSRNQFAQRSNIEIALEFMRSTLKLPLVNINTEGVFRHTDPRMMLGLTWSLIRAFLALESLQYKQKTEPAPSEAAPPATTNHHSGPSAEEELLQWVNETTHPHGLQPLSDFHASGLADGRVLCALVALVQENAADLIGDVEESNEEGDAARLDLILSIMTRPVEENGLDWSLPLQASDLRGDEPMDDQCVIAVLSQMRCLIGDEIDRIHERERREEADELVEALRAHSPGSRACLGSGDDDPSERTGLLTGEPQPSACCCMGKGKSCTVL
eukprot:gnl/Trimastix_PCT/776.p1 GENE.gnl/Trimastix_PCT/776~~gnl/Trimastix_PCT/776.p1  ORF type:complete len:438 (-),score=63.55 gnl/Trimastix_PCT/776:95-1408(-)